MSDDWLLRRFSGLGLVAYYNWLQQFVVEWDRLESAGAVLKWPSLPVDARAAADGGAWVFDSAVTMAFVAVAASSKTVGWPCKPNFIDAKKVCPRCLVPYLKSRETGEIPAFASPPSANFFRSEH